MLIYRELCAEKSDTADAAAYLTGIKEVQILPHRSIDDIRQQYDPEIYESISDIISEHKDYEDPIEILDDAYYSIACDYWILIISSGIAGS